MRAVEFEGAEGNMLRGDVRGEKRDRPTVLFMHGGGQTRHSWAGAASEVAADFETVALDARGHGDSDWPETGDYRFSAMAADLLAVCAAVRSRTSSRPVVVGASMGGLAAMLAGESEPDAFAGLVLVDITPRMEQTGVDRILAFMAEHSSGGFGSVEEAGDAVAAYLPGRARPGSLDGLTRNLRRCANGRWYWHWDPRFVTGPLAVERHADGHAERLEAGLRGLDCPILLVRGTRSDLVSQDAVDEFRAAVPNAEIVDIGNAGHMVVGDRNDAFTEATMRFLARF